ncbi:MAG: MucR family transcriptional regulator, partial [Mesorhizobium sp.]
MKRNFAHCFHSIRSISVTEEAENNTDALIELTADIVSAYVSKNPVPLGELPALIGQVHAALKGIVGGSPE